MKVWLVRAGKHGEREDFALENDLAVIGFAELPDLKQASKKEDLRKIIEATFPTHSPAKVSNFTGQLYSFAHRMEKGDIIALPRKSSSTIALGKVTGDYLYREDLGDVHHVRKVDWAKMDVSRDQFGQDLLYSLGAFMTVCQIKRNNAAERFERILNGHADPGLGPTTPGNNDMEDDGDTAPLDVEQIARGQIHGHIEANFKGHELSRLVEAVLVAEGYQTKLSPPGPDGGVDILAGRGALGFESPRLCVQVKSSSSPCDVTVFRGLQGSMATFKADQGLLVCWGGFNKVVMKEANLSHFSVRLWSADDLLESVLRNYDRLPEEMQADLPLKRIWALVLEE